VDQKAALEASSKLSAEGRELIVKIALTAPEPRENKDSTNTTSSPTSNNNNAPSPSPTPAAAKDTPPVKSDEKSS
jgi:hypothetical protein